MSKPSSWTNSSLLFNSFMRESGGHIFSKSINLKGNVIARLEFELAYLQSITLANTPPELPLFLFIGKCMLI